MSAASLPEGTQNGGVRVAMTDITKIDITKATATTIKEAAFGHLLLCWIDNNRYCAIRVSEGVLCFYAPVTGSVDAAVRRKEPDSTVCLDVGTAVVRWCDTDAVQRNAREPPGTIVVDQIGISITGKEAQADSIAYSQGRDQGAWRLADGEPQNGPTRLVIQNWEIGVRGDNGEFVKFESFPRATPQAQG